MTRKRKCHSKSNSFVTAAEQVCLQPVLEHRQRRGRRNIAWQAIPHLCSSNRKSTTSDSFHGVGQMSSHRSIAAAVAVLYDHRHIANARYCLSLSLSLIHSPTICGSNEQLAQSDFVGVPTCASVGCQTCCRYRRYLFCSSMDTFIHQNGRLTDRDNI